MSQRQLEEKEGEEEEDEEEERLSGEWRRKAFPSPSAKNQDWIAFSFSLFCYSKRKRGRKEKGITMISVAPQVHAQMLWSKCRVSVKCSRRSIYVIAHVKKKKVAYSTLKSAQH